MKKAQLEVNSSSVRVFGAHNVISYVSSKIYHYET